MLYVLSVTLDYYHTGQCKSTGGCYNEVVVAIFRTGADVKGKVDLLIYL